MRKTPVYLTVDLECLKDSGNYTGPIYGNLSEQNESFGLDFILNTLKKYNLKATFFTEPYFSYRFGIEPLKEICEKILSDQHDVQLHIHPLFKSVNNNSLYNDFLFSYGYDEQVELISEAKELLLKCGVPQITAMRAGHFSADNTTYNALKACGLNISSNYNLNYIGRTCNIEFKELHNDFFMTADDILELPITCFRERNLLHYKTGFGLQKTFRHMEISAISHSEMEYMIKNAKKLNLKNVVIIFHTFEFVHFTDHKKVKGRPNRTTIQRFLKLCRFLSNNRSAVEVKIISDIDYNQYSYTPSAGDNIPEMPLKHTLYGKMEQMKKRIEMLV